MGDRVLTKNFILGKTRLDNIANVKNLNFWGQELTDVSIISEMPFVEVVSLSVNNITTLKPFENCQKLRELYLRKNKIEELSEVEYLKELKNLKVLWLAGNPCADVENYRLRVISFLDGLTKLDDDDITNEERDQAKQFKGRELGVPVDHNRPTRSPSPKQKSPPVSKTPTQVAEDCEIEVVAKPRHKLARTPPKKDSPKPSHQQLESLDVQDTPVQQNVRRMRNDDTPIGGGVAVKNPSRSASPSVRESVRQSPVPQQSQPTQEDFVVHSKHQEVEEIPQRIQKQVNEPPQPRMQYDDVSINQPVQQDRRTANQQPPYQMQQGQYQNYNQQPQPQPQQYNQNYVQQGYGQPYQGSYEESYDPQMMNYPPQRASTNQRSRWESSPQVLPGNIPYYPPQENVYNQQSAQQHRRYSSNQRSVAYDQQYPKSNQIPTVNRNVLLNVVLDLIHELDNERIIIVRQEIDRIMNQ